MDHTQFAVVVVIILGLSAASFGLGWNVAESRERRAHRLTKQTLAAIKMRERDLLEWLSAQMPDTLAAYRHGHREGYQQGVYHAATLEADDEAAP